MYITINSRCRSDRPATRLAGRKDIRAGAEIVIMSVVLALVFSIGILYQPICRMVEYRRQHLAALQVIGIDLQARPDQVDDGPAGVALERPSPDSHHGDAQLLDLVRVIEK